MVLGKSSSVVLARPNHEDFDKKALRAALLASALETQE